MSLERASFQDKRTALASLFIEEKFRAWPGIFHLSRLLERPSAL
jgi:hypothetical protein